MKNRVLVPIVGVLIIIEIISIFLMSETLLRKDLITKDKETVDLKEIKFAIMIEQNEGKEDFVRYNNSEWPKEENGYVFDSDNSYCYDKNKEPIYDILTFKNNKAYVNTSKTSFCNLYFKKSAFATAKAQLNFTNGNGTTVSNKSQGITLSWTVGDATHYCIQTSSSSDSCEWKEIKDKSSKSVTETVTLSSEGKNTYYGFVRDKYYVEKDATANIYLETLASATVTFRFEKSKQTVNETTQNVTLSWTAGNATHYCIQTSSSSSSCEWKEIKDKSSRSVTETVTLSTGDGKKTYYGFVKESSTIKGDNDYVNYEELITDTTPNLRNICKDSKLSECMSKKEDEVETIPNVTCNQGEMCRYQGTEDQVDNNWLCFGTSDSDKCKTGSDREDKNLYRIIGVTPEGLIKVIKKEALNNGYTWYSSVNANKPWSNSTLYQNINGSAFLNNTSYVPTAWKNKIYDFSWIYGSMYIMETHVSALEMYNKEKGKVLVQWLDSPGITWPLWSYGYWSYTINAKIGLMYLHDYYYAAQKDGLDCSTSSNSTGCKASWIYLWNNSNDINSPVKERERIITNFGYLQDYESAAYVIPKSSIVTHIGDYQIDSVNTTLALGSVRPVFYLVPSTVIKSGNGTFENPYVISD